MKCEKCNEREANFFYSSNINGNMSQRHLCSECAHEEGFGELLRPGAMFDDAFDGLFDDFFSPMRSFMSLPSFDFFGGGRGRIMAPSFPRLRIVLDEPKPATKEAKPAMEVDEATKLLREKEALKAQLAEAVKDENFEKAIELRDRLNDINRTRF